MLASSEYFPEVAEEDQRVATVRPFCLPERWFVPRPEEKVKTWRGEERTHFLRRPQSCVLRNRGGRFRDVSDEIAATAPRFIPCPDRVKALVELLTLNPNRIWEVYRRAVEGQNQAILAALIEAATKLPDVPRANARSIVRTFPKNESSQALRAALA